MEVSLIPQRELLQVGLAGIGRIKHVDNNSQLKGAIHGKKRQLLTEIRDVQLLYHRLGLATLVPWTIHNGSVCWPAETSQDKANTFIILHQPQAASDILMEAIKKTAAIVSSHKGINLYIPDETLKLEKPEEWKRRKIYLGSLSAMGVLWARKARLDKHLGTLILGLNLVKDAYKFEPNPHRLATIALWTIRASFDGNNFKSDFLTRAEGIALGIQSLAISFLRSPKDSWLAIINKGS